MKCVRAALGTCILISFSKNHIFLIVMIYRGAKIEYCKYFKKIVHNITMIEYPVPV